MIANGSVLDIEISKGIGPAKRVNKLTLGGKEERIACRRLSARYVNTRSPGPTPAMG